MLVSIVIPAYNEKDSIAEVIREAAALTLEKEILAVDDGSRDGTSEIVRDLQPQVPGLQGIFLPVNRGKGFAVREGIRAARGEIVVIQDADREYPPGQIPILVRELEQDPELAAVFGSRMLRKNPISYRRYYWGGRFLSALVNLAGAGRLTDVTTGHKAVRREILGELALKSDGFEIEMEIVMKLLRGGFRIREIPIEYRPRSFAEGKKISWRDGISSIRMIVRSRAG